MWWKITTNQDIDTRGNDMVLSAMLDKFAEKCRKFDVAGLSRSQQMTVDGNYAYMEYALYKAINNFLDENKQMTPRQRADKLKEDISFLDRRIEIYQKVDTLLSNRTENKNHFLSSEEEQG
jgi:hypothetical protein